MKIGVGQITSTSNLLLNGIKASNLVQKAYKAGCKILFLPEASDYIAGSPEETVSLAEPVNKSDFVTELLSAISKWPIYVSVGVHEPARHHRNHIYNTLLFISPQGQIINRYHKVHLFDADVPNGPILRESRSVARGRELPKPIEVIEGEETFVLGPQICYDIRFPESSMYLRQQGANILVFPSAFTVKTGEAHWHSLNVARAIDNQCFVISAAQVGKHDPQGKRESYGHSIVVDPWGRVLGEDISGKDENLLIVDLDFKKIEEVRGNMPLEEQRKHSKVVFPTSTDA